MQKDSAEPETEEPRQRRGCLARVVRLAFFAFVLGLTFHAFFLRALVENELRARIDPAGTGWNLDVRSVGWNGLELAGVRAGGDGRIEVQSLRVDYDPFELRKGHIRRLQVVGATWELRWGSDGLDLGWPGSEGEVDDADRAEGRVPRIDRLDLFASTLVLRSENGLWRVPLEGRVDWNASGRLELELDLELAGVPLRVHGSLPAPGTSGAVDLSLAHAVRDGGPLTIEGTLGDGTLAQIAGRLGPEETLPWSFEAGGRLGALDEVLANRRVTLKDALFGLGGELARNGSPTTVAGAMSFAELRVDEHTLYRTKLSLTPAGERFQLELAARGEGWELVELAAELAPQAVGSERIEVVLSDEAHLDLELEGGRVRLQALANDGRAGRLAIDPQTGLRSLELELPRLDVIGSNLARSVLQFEVAGLDFELPLAVSASSGQLAVGLAADGRLKARSLSSADDSEAQLRAGPLDLSLTGDATLTMALAEARKIGASGKLALTQTAPFEVANDALRVLGTHARVEAELGGDQDRPLQPSLRAAIELERLGRPDGELELVGIVAELPGAFKVESVVWGDARLPGPSGLLRRDEGTLELSGSWAPTPGATLALTGRAHAAERLIALHAKSDGAAIQRDDALEQLLVERADVHFAGEIDVEASWRSDRDGTRSGLLVLAENGSLESLDGAHQLDGTALALELVDLREPRSSGPAWLRWTSGKSGALALGAGEVRFSLEGPSVFLVQGSEVVTAEKSTFRTQGFRLDPAAPATEVHVLCQDLSLEEWLRLATSDRAVGEGRLNGNVTLSIDLAKDPAFALVGGHLASLGKGSLQLDDAEAVGVLLEQGMDAYTVEGGLDLSQMLRDRIVGALKEFAYESLVFELVPEEEDLTLKAICNGKGVQIPQELDLAVNFKGFGSLLALLLDLELGTGE